MEHLRCCLLLGLVLLGLGPVASRKVRVAGAAVLGGGCSCAVLCWAVL